MWSLIICTISSCVICKYVNDYRLVRSNDPFYSVNAYKAHIIVVTNYVIHLIWHTSSGDIEQALALTNLLLFQL